MFSILLRTALALDGHRTRQVATSVGRMHVVETRGRGPLPPIVLLHGLTSAALHFYPLVRRLRGRVRHVIAPDLPAHGESEAPPSLRPDVLERGLVESLDAVVREPSIVFGSSLGGAAAVTWARARPERVRGLILCSPGGAAMDPDQLRRFVRTFEIDTHADALEFIDRVLAKRSRFRHLLAWSVRRRFSDPSMRQLLATVTPADLLAPADLAALRMPVLLMWGQEERILPRAHLEFFRRHLPAHARIDEAEGLGHAPYLDDAGAVACRILAFAADIHHGVAADIAA